jgi:hypothetical protein
MDELADLRLSNGAHVRIRLNQDEATIDDATGKAARLTAAAGKSLRDAMSQVKAIGEDLSAIMIEFEPTPREVTVAFGIDLGVEAGVTIANMSAKANFTATITWDGASR